VFYAIRLAPEGKLECQQINLLVVLDGEVAVSAFGGAVHGLLGQLVQAGGGGVAIRPDDVEAALVALDEGALVHDAAAALEAEDARRDGVVHLRLLGDVRPGELEAAVAVAGPERLGGPGHVGDGCGPPGGGVAFGGGRRSGPAIP